MRERAELSVGKTYNRLTVIKTFHEGGYARAECKCSCGNVRVYLLGNVKRGLSRSCGCYFKDIMREWRPRTHGQSNRKKPTSEYWTWGSMKRRCKDVNDQAYPQYGGRGITVCERWEKFENFFADMGKKPSPKHSIDRLDNNAGYYPENCRWATSIEQMNNRRCNTRYNILGKQMTQIEVCRLYGIDETTLHRRVKSGMTVMQAVACPLGHKRGWIED